MNFKQALIAHFQGEKVQAKGFMTRNIWGDFLKLVQFVEIGSIREDFAQDYEFRIAPRTIIVNGVEVPEGESVFPEYGGEYFLADPFGDECLYREGLWASSKFQKIMLERGLVYLNKKDAIARAKAMLITN